MLAVASPPLRQGARNEKKAARRKEEEAGFQEAHRGERATVNDSQKVYHIRVVGTERDKRGCTIRA